MKVIKGKDIASRINSGIKTAIEGINASTGQRPRLVSLVVGHSEDAEIYVNMQRKTAELVGIEFDVMEMEGGVSQKQIIDRIRELNEKKDVTAVILQKPLPENVDHNRVVEYLKPEKDAEGIHPYNLGEIMKREADIVPCTPGAIMNILKASGVELYGREVVIIGHSSNVGKPLSMMMLNETATTTICHIGTAEKGDIKAHARRADVLVVAVGSARMVKSDWVSEGTVVIDVGINACNGKIVGDVDFEGVRDKAALITPVPGGVGPVTVSILMRNVLRAYIKQQPGDE